MQLFGRKWQKNSAEVPKRPVVINLSTKVQPTHTALIIFTSSDSREIQAEVERLVKSNNNIIPGDLPRHLEKFGEVFTEWEGILIDVEPERMMDISRLGPVS